MGICKEALMAKGRGTGPAVNLDSSVDGEGQEGVGSVEDVDQR